MVKGRSRLLIERYYNVALVMVCGCETRYCNASLQCKNWNMFTVRIYLTKTTGTTQYYCTEQGFFEVLEVC